MVNQVEIQGQAKASMQPAEPQKKYTKTAIAVAVIGVAILAVGILALTPVIIAIPAAAAIAMVAAGGAMMLGGGIWAIMQGLSKEKAINPTSPITPRTGSVSSNESVLVVPEKKVTPLTQNASSPPKNDDKLTEVEEVDMRLLDPTSAQPDLVPSFSAHENGAATSSSGQQEVPSTDKGSLAAHNETTTFVASPETRAQVVVSLCAVRDQFFNYL